MEFNINDKVRVKLTDYGRQVHRADRERLYAQLGMKGDYVPPKEDENGWSEWQLWVLMEELGRHLRLGGETPFETTIELVERSY